MLVYGQIELMRNLYEPRDRLGDKVVHNAENVTLYDVQSDKPYVTYRSGDRTIGVDCEYVVSADGFTVSPMPAAARKSRRRRRG